MSSEFSWALPSISNIDRKLFPTHFRFADWNTFVPRHSIRVLRFHRKHSKRLQSESSNRPNSNSLEQTNLWRSYSKLYWFRSPRSSINVSFRNIYHPLLDFLALGGNQVFQWDVIIFPLKFIIDDEWVFRLLHTFSLNKMKNYYFKTMVNINYCEICERPLTVAAAAAINTVIHQNALLHIPGHAMTTQKWKFLNLHLFISPFSLGFLPFTASFSFYRWL